MAATKDLRTICAVFGINHSAITTKHIKIDSSAWPSPHNNDRLNQPGTGMSHWAMQAMMCGPAALVSVFKGFNH